MPNWDQWDGEGLAVYLPYGQHQLKPIDLFTPHNEHRIFFTKLTGLILLKIGGQWDARVEVTVNTLLWAFLATTVFLAARQMVSLHLEPLIFLACTLAFALPIAWQNILGGFHSQQCFQLAFSTAAIWLMVSKPILSKAWWCGALCALLANFTMGAGLLASCAIAIVCSIRFAFKRATWHATWPTLIVVFITTAVGVLTHVPTPDSFKAQSVLEFTLALFHCLQWPFCGLGKDLPNEHAWWLGLLLYSPIVLFTGYWLLTRKSTTRTDDVLFCSGCWVVLQIAAIAYARGAGAPWPASRYLDNLIFGLLINAIAILKLTNDWLGQRKWLSLIWAASWFLPVIIGLYMHTAKVVSHEMPEQRDWLREGEKNVYAYLNTNDPAYLNPHEIPYPSADALRERMDHPEITKILPQSIRQAQHISLFQAGSGFDAESVESQKFTPAYDGYVRIILPELSEATNIRFIDAQTRQTITDTPAACIKRAEGLLIYYRVPDEPIVMTDKRPAPHNQAIVYDVVDVSRLSFYSMILVRQNRIITIVSCSIASITLLLMLALCFRESHYHRIGNIAQALP